ncbi:MAG: 3-hydroxybutyryl-CoA dehydrogenase [Halanaerobiales bacterium]
MKQIAIVGAGTMGSGIAQVFASAGYSVILNDLKMDFLDNAFLKIEKNLDYLIRKEKITVEEKEEILGRLEKTTDLSSISEADLVIEAVTEKMDIKKEIFQKLDDICKQNTILASNTSALSVSEIALSVERTDKVMGIHFFNPVPVMRLVELIKAANTSEQTFQSVKKLVKSTGKVIVEVEESPGFIVNRLLIPLINEAIFLLYEGVASKEDIDNAIKYGANHPMGPLALADLIGLDVCLSIMETLYKDFSDPKYRTCPLLLKKVRAGELGKKTGKGFYSY